MKSFTWVNRVCCDIKIFEFAMKFGSEKNICKERVCVKPIVLSERFRIAGESVKIYRLSPTGSMHVTKQQILTV